MRDYNIDPADPGHFLTSAEVRGDDYEREISSAPCKGGTLYTYDKPRENPRPEFKFFCRVGGGFQAFRTRRAAVNHQNQPA